jgi:hypothetical protein
MTAPMTATMRSIGVLLVAGLVSCRAQPGASASEPVPAPEPAVPPVPASGSAAALSPLEDPSFERVTSVGRRYEVCWRAESGTLPRNQDCALELWVFEDGKPAPGLVVSMRAWMPDHGHGMLRLPRTIDQGDGSYRVEGVLLHMRGHWELGFDLLDGAEADVAKSELHL